MLKGLSTNHEVSGEEGCPRYKRDYFCPLLEGNPRKVYDLAREGKLIMLLSDDMEKEFIRVLGYEKFGLSPQEIMPSLETLELMQDT